MGADNHLRSGSPRAASLCCYVPAEPSEFAYRLAELQVHSAHYLVVHGVPNSLSASCLSNGRVRDEQTGLHHGLQRGGDSRRGKAESVSDLAAGGWSVLSEVADDAGAY
jgi:hypothetical protein